MAEAPGIPKAEIAGGGLSEPGAGKDLPLVAVQADRRPNKTRELPALKP